MKKKLIFFIGGLNFGGMERVVFIAAELLKEMYDITIVTLYQTDADYEINAKLYNLDVPPKAGKLAKAIGFCRRLIRTHKMKKDINPDIVFSFGMYSNYLNALTKRNEKIIMGIRSYDWLTKPFVTSWLDKYIVSKFDSVNSVSKLIAKDAQKYWGIPVEKNRVIYNPYDINYIQENALEQIDDYEFDENKFYYISMGRLSHQKGYDHLIKAFELVAREIDNVHLVIMGNGDKRRELESLVETLGLKNRVDILEGKKNPYKYVKHAQAYVLSSYTEGFPNALVETMCVGIPVISVNCKSGPAEILYIQMKESEDEKFIFELADYGILCKEIVESNDVKKNDVMESALADAMRFSYKNVEITKALAQKATKRVEEFSYDKFKDALCIEIDNV